MSDPKLLVPKKKHSIFDPEHDLEKTWQQVEIAAAEGDHRKVVLLLKRLHKLGIWRATARIGEFYELGGVGGFEKNIGEALIWYRKAVFDSDDPIAHLGLGRIYFSGCGAVDADLTNSRVHLVKAYEAGVPQAGIYLGQMSMFGMGVATDFEEARRFFTSAAAGRFPIAYLYLAGLEARTGRIFQALRMRFLGLMLTGRLKLEDWNHANLWKLPS